MSTPASDPSSPAAEVDRRAWHRPWLLNGCVIALLAILYLELALTARIHSMTVDEGNHIYSGYMSWKRSDFGLNPEHPPLVKWLATLPLLAMPINAPPPGEIYYKLDAYIACQSGPTRTAWLRGESKRGLRRGRSRLRLANCFWSLSPGLSRQGEELSVLRLPGHMLLVLRQ